MGGVVRSIISPGAAKAKRKAKREKREVEAANKKAQDAADKLKKENELKQQAAGKKRIRRSGTRRVFTSPLGLSDEGINKLG